MLNRARAIENGCFVLAAAQGGKHENGRETFGHSMVVDPWGRVLAEGGTEPGLIMAEIDPAEVVAARGAHPVAPARPALRDHRAHGGARAPACREGPGMIRYTLVCERKHDFESWFQNSAAFDKQVARKLVTCPVCGSSKVEKAIMAPSLARKDKVHVDDRARAAERPARNYAAANRREGAGRHDVAAGARVPLPSSRSCATT